MTTNRTKTFTIPLTDQRHFEIYNNKLSILHGGGRGPVKKTSSGAQATSISLATAGC